MPTPQPDHCPVCESLLKSPRSRLEDVYFDCPQCGLFGLTTSAEHLLPDLIDGLGRNRGVLSYGISQMPRVGPNTPLFTFAECAAIIKAGVLPTPQEQADNLIRLLGYTLTRPGDTIKLSFEAQKAQKAQKAQEALIAIGAQSESGFRFVLNGLISSGLVQGQEFPAGYSDVTLSFAGWERFEVLRRGTPSSRKVFIAMKYDDPVLDAIVNKHFKPAVAETGFVLRRLDDEQPAGLIDDRLRVEIQSSRFLLVDLTHSNLGAYWEAGYAEGPGKPVIYTCEESKFAEASHFDTNHHLHVLWNASDIQPALLKLKTTIRATIPEATRE